LPKINKLKKQSMKKQILSIASAMFLAGTMFLASCGKDDTNAPVITLKGDAEVVIYLGSDYTEQGATATDKDGKDNESDVSTSIKITGTVDKTKAGAYTITYNCSDEAGNAATAVTRKVTVKHSNATLSGSYTGTESCNFGPVAAYNGTVSNGTTGILSIVAGNLGNFTSTINVPATLSGDFNEKITLTSGNYGGLSMSGTGTIEPDGKKITITYSADTDNCTATWNKQ
jgi:hypothetical protein